MSTEIDRIYLGHDNTLDYLLRADGQPADWGSTVTRVQIKIGSSVIDSDETDVITWDQQPLNGVQVWVLHVKAGIWEPPGSRRPLRLGSQRLWVIVYDAEHPEGLVWGSREAVEVISE